MLHTLLNYLPAANGRRLPYWEQTVLQLWLRQDLLTKRYLAAELPLTKGVRSLIKLLHKVNLNQYLSIAADGDRCLLFEETTAAMLETHAVPKRTLRCSHDVWSGGIPELRCFVAPQYPFLCLPLDQPFAYWRRLQPVHWHWWTSNELASNWSSGKLPIQPTETAIMTIDHLMLTLMYVKYAERCQLQELPVSAYGFVKHYLFPTFYEDSKQIWLANLLWQLSSQELPISELPTNLGISSDLQQRLHKLQAQFKPGISGTALIRLFNTNFGQGSIRDQCHQLITERLPLDTPGYDHLRFLIEYPYLRLALQLLQLGQLPRQRALLKQLQHQTDTLQQRGLDRQLPDDSSRWLYRGWLGELSGQLLRLLY